MDPGPQHLAFLLKEDECLRIESHFRCSKGQPRIRQNALIDGLLTCALGRARLDTEWMSCGLVTQSEDRTPLGGHYDPVVGQETHKLLVYLDDTAGTDFFATPDGPVSWSVDARRGDAVLFPITLYHASKPFAPGLIKRTVGLRLRKKSCAPR